MRTQSLLDYAGLRFDTRFAHDPQFYAALAAAPLGLGALGLLYPGWLTGSGSGPMADSGPVMPALLAFVFWQPFVEELLFRGVIQGQLASMHRARQGYAGISLANVATSVLFVLAHLVNQPFWWAIAVFVPSLVFGYFRDRHRSIFPALVLHAAYNALFLLAAFHRA